eukprot:TRINITY_DN34918_c0_g1_i1.p1 TRINITY_DN34918_c0_g1~~TRINITY_DN34918_c0_g1_i1.p1  ORF type:complete len:907 (+),score=326.96 TRINITY_DN34918_c0_g1_i1:115-2721(+)
MRAALLALAAAACIASAEDGAPSEAMAEEPPVELQEAKRANLWYGAGALVSALCCIALVVSYHRSPPSARMPPAGLLRNRAVCDIGCAFGAAYPTLSSDVEITRDFDCAVQAAVLYFFALTSFLWWLCLSMDLLTSVRNPFSDPAGNLRFFHLVVWSTAGGGTAVVYAFGDPGRTKFEFCWMERRALDISLFWAPLAVGFALGIAVLIWVRLVAKVALPATHRLRRVAIVQGQWYVAGIGGYWAFLLLVTFVAAADEGTTAVVAQTTAAIALRGIVDLLLWLKSLQLSAAACSPSAARRRGSLPDQGEEMPQTPRFRHGSLGEALVQEPGGAEPAPGPRPRAPSEPASKGELKEALRRDMMRACQQGIEEMARLAAEEALLRTRGGGAAPVPETMDYDRVECRQLVRHDSDGVRFTFFDFAPLVFHSLRAANGIEPAIYRAVFSVFDVDDAMSEKFSDGGRSGSFFYFTADREYIVKTVTPGERHVLRQMLPSYFRHMTTHPDSLIVRFYGLHAIRMHAGAKRIEFVVMDNILLTKRKISEVFDIKGSWVDRGPVKPDPAADCACAPSSPSAKVVQFLMAREQSGNKCKSVLKDLDLVGSKSIWVGSEVRARLLEQIRLDCAFFCEHNVMDYSLLVGCHSAEWAQVRVGKPELAIDLRALTAPPVGDAWAGPASGTGYLPPRLEQKLGRFATQLECGISDLRTDPALGARNISFQSAVMSALAVVPSHYRASQPPGDVHSTMQNSSALHNVSALTSWPGAPLHSEACLSDEADPDGAVPVAVTYPAHRPFYRRDEGGLHTACDREGFYTGDAMYFLGIIDILQTWTWRKRLERGAKTRCLRKDPAGISACEPHAYSERFQRRCAEIFT